jgi:hypothetical protein
MPIKNVSGGDDDNTVLYSFMCLLNNPKANYKVSRAKGKKQNKCTDTNKRHKVTCIDNNNSIIIIRQATMQRQKKIYLYSS